MLVYFIRMYQRRDRFYWAHSLLRVRYVLYHTLEIVSCSVLGSSWFYNFDRHILYLNFAMAFLWVLQRHFQVVSRLQTNTTPPQPCPVVVGTPCERTPVHDTRSDLGRAGLLSERVSCGTGWPYPDRVWAHRTGPGWSLTLVRGRPQTNSVVTFVASHSAVDFI